MVRLTGFLVPAALVLAQASVALSLPRPELRDLPTPVVIWKLPDSGRCELTIEEATAYVAAGGAVTAVDVATGRQIWTLACSAGEQPERPPLVLGDTVIAAFGPSVYAIDRSTGARIASAELEVPVSRLTGPPLAVVLRFFPPAESHAEILALDPRSLRVLGRSRHDGVSELLAHNGVLVAELNSGEESVVAGFSHPALEKLWSLHEEYPRLLVEGEELLFVANDVYRPLDARTGTLAAPRPQREPSEISGGDSWEFETMRVEDDGTTYLRRNDPKTGKSLWTVPIPGSWKALPSEDSVWVHASPGIGAQGFLIQLDGASGATRWMMAGQRNVAELWKVGGVLIIHGLEDGIVAVSSTKLGPPASELRSPAQEVMRILDRLEAEDAFFHDVRAGTDELAALGPDVLPRVVEELGRRKEVSAVIAAADLIARSRHRPAAAVLAARLAAPIVYPESYPDLETTYAENDAQVAILRALALVGGPPEVPAIALIVAKPANANVRQAAMEALSAIGTPEALAAIDAARPPDSTTPWFLPPSPSRFLAHLGAPLSEEEEMALWREDRNEEAALRRAGSRSARVETEKGAGLIVFPSPALGGHADYWAAAVDASGAVAPAFFLGVLPAGVSRGLYPQLEVPVTATLSGGLLVVSATKTEDGALRVSLDEARRDGDGDGLTDLVELRLHLRPDSDDTDGDGVRDDVDRAPNAERQEPASEEEAIMLAILRHRLDQGRYELGDGEMAMPAVVRGLPALEWRGGDGVIVTLTDEESDALREQIGGDGLSYYSIERVTSSTEDDLHPTSPADLGPDERLYSIVRGCGSLNADGHDVVVRKVGGRWVVVSMKMTWIS